MGHYALAVGPRKFADLAAQKTRGEEIRRFHAQPKRAGEASPRSTVPTGPYLVNGPWSLQLHPNGKANFTASLTMVRSDLWFIETGGDPESQADRNFHTHHVLVTDGQVSTVGSAIVVDGTAIVTSNGNQVFPGSTVQIEISGGTAVAPSNIKVTFGAPASGHFTSQPYEGVVFVR